MGPVGVLVIAIIIISAVVGLIAQFLNKMNEMNPGRRQAAAARGGGDVKQSDRDMDRFLAEIDRLRKRNAEAADQPKEQQEKKPAPAKAAPVAPAAKPARKPPAAKPRIVAELADTQPERASGQRGADAQGFVLPPSAPVSPITSGSSSRPEDLPVATVVSPNASTGAPATRVTVIPQRNRPAPKTPLARSLTGLLNSGQGVAMAVILQEVLGPPKCQK